MPVWATAIAVVAVLGFLVYAFYTLSEQLVTEGLFPVAHAV